MRMGDVMLNLFDLGLGLLINHAAYNRAVFQTLFWMKLQCYLAAIDIHFHEMRCFLCIAVF